MPYSFFPKNNEHGFTTLALVLLLIVGLTVGVVQAKIEPTATNQIKRDPLLGIRVSDPKNIDAAVKLGVSKIRVSVESADAFYNQTVEQKSFFTPITQIFKSSQANNLQLIIVVKPASTVELGDLENRIGLLKQNLAANTNIVFELGNEPNGKAPNGENFWNGDYNSFASYIKDSSTIIRKHWPSTPIIIGALDMQGKINGSTEDAARADFNAYLNALSQKVTLANFDYAMHSYHDVSWFNRVYAIHREELDKRNLSSKLWVTETGVHLPEDNPQNLIDIIRAAEAKSDIKAVVIHSLDSTDGFQLWNGGPNEIYTKVQTFVNENPKSITATINIKTTGPSGSGPAINAADKSCGNNPVAPPSANLVWHAFCAEKDYATGHFTCNSNADCPQNTIQTGSGITAGTSNQCVLFKEGSRCIQLRLLKSDSGQNLYTANDPAFNTPNDTWTSNPQNIPFGKVGLAPNEGTGKSPRADFTYFINSWEKTIARIKEDTRVKELLKAEDVKKQEELLVTAEQAAKEAKEANEAWLKDKSNPELAKKASDAAKKASDAVTAAEALRKLAKLEQLLKGDTKEMCVKADLGIRPWLQAKRLKSRGENTREDGSPGEKMNRFLRLYVCSGSNGQPKWRVATEGNDNKQDAQNENSMERILRLHADSETSPNYPTPKYPFTEVEGSHATLYGQDEATIRQSLEKYINAAKAGKAEINETSAPAAQ